MMMLVLKRVAALLLFCWAPVTAQAALEQNLTALCEAKIARDRIPGLSCAAFVGDRIVFARGFGRSDVENDVPATSETVYRLASISKPITAVLVLQLAEEGALDLDQDLHGLVPEWPKKRWPVTTRQLLGHLGGVRHYQGEGESTRRYANQRAGLLRFARKSVEAQPGYAGAWITLANALGQLGRLDEARAAMGRALKANPALTPQHLADQIRILAGGSQDHADKSLAGLKAAGLL